MFRVLEFTFFFFPPNLVYNYRYKSEKGRNECCNCQLSLSSQLYAQLYDFMAYVWQHSSDACILAMQGLVCKEYFVHAYSKRKYEILEL